MDQKRILKSSVNKIVFALITQMFILLCSLVTSLIVPKYMGTTQYGYWQIYYFYLNYINFITLGYNDGFLLKYGGKEKEELPIERIRSANRILCLFSVIIAILGIVVVSFMNFSNDIKYICVMLFLSMPFVCIFNIIVSFFLAINRQQVYNKVNFLSRFLATVGYCILLFSGIIGYKHMIVVDYGIRAIIAFSCIFIGSYFIIGKKDSWKIGFQEIFENCSSGIFVTAGALLASFMPMAGRIVLQKEATIEQYAIFSFALSVLALVVTFTNTAGVVFFPILKNLKENQLLCYYEKLEWGYNCLIVIALGVYIPAVLVIQYYLSEYVSVLEYMYVIFMLCIPLGKFQMLITPYMKAFRMEKQYFVANILGVLAVLTSTNLIYKLTNSIYMVALITLFVFVLWSLLLESYLKRKLKIGKKRNILFELLLIFIFTLSGKSGNLKVYFGMYGMIIGVMIFVLLKKTMYMNQNSKTE